MYEGASSSDSGCEVRVSREYLLRSVVRGNYDMERSYLNCSTLLFGGKGVLVTPSFEVMSERLVSKVEIVDKYGILSLIAIKPLVARFVIVVGICESSCT